MAFLVYSINGDASEATKNSELFSPIPMAIGLPNLATMISSGISISKTAIA